MEVRRERKEINEKERGQRENVRQGPGSECLVEFEFRKSMLSVSHDGLCPVCSYLLTPLAGIFFLHLCILLLPISHKTLTRL